MRYPLPMETQNPFRLLPQVDEVLGRPVVEPFVERVGRDLCRGFVQDVLSDWRGEIAAGLLDADGVTARLEASLEPGGLVECLRAKVDEEAGRGVVPVVNAAGVVLHTGLGRAPVHPEAAAAMAERFKVVEAREKERLERAKKAMREARVTDESMLKLTEDTSHITGARLRSFDTGDMMDDANIDVTDTKKTPDQIGQAAAQGMSSHISHGTSRAMKYGVPVASGSPKRASRRVS